MIALLTILLTLQPAQPPGESATWGFYGHRLINRMAVFTLPSDMIGIYKEHIDYVSDHAVDPDKRRYATKHEAVRHYIDIDHWGTYPFENVPRKWNEALAKHTSIFCARAGGDTTLLMDSSMVNQQGAAFVRFFGDHLLSQYYDEVWEVDCDTLQAAFPEVNCSSCAAVFASEGFSAYGILPYHLVAMQRRLTDAFVRKDLNSVLRLSADFGHYIGDAHVPLHTTKNYNGQLTNQVGIHAFWESRIPELFAEEEYDFFVGRAEYIRNPEEYYWDIVLKSHSLVEDVLEIEKELSKTFPDDAQYCFDERLSVTIRTQCPEYAKAYSEAMRGMVEERMRQSIRAVGSAWYTAWVDAGQPQLGDLAEVLTPEQEAELEALEREFRLGEAKGRGHPD